MPGRWLVNDALGQLGERTLWTDLKEAFNLNFEPVPYDQLPDFIEAQKPDLVIRNASYFRPLNVKCKQISLVQDLFPCCGPLNMQRAVISESTVAVYNTQYTRDKVGCPNNVTSRVIPLGVDSDFWYPIRNAITENQKNFIKRTILWVGSSHTIKGWQLFQQIVEQSDFHFICVTKDDAKFLHKRCDSLGIASQERIRELASYCSACLCTSETETQHLSGIEAAFCGLPIVAPKIGIYYDMAHREHQWGKIVDSRNPGEFIAALNWVLEKKDLTPRRTFLDFGLDKSTCLSRWGQLIRDVEGGENE